MIDPGSVLERTFGVFIERLKQEAFDLPNYRFWHFGELAFDAELFAVHSVGVYQGAPGSPSGGFNDATGGITFYSMDVAVTLLRGFPQLDNAGRPPSAEVLIRAAKRTAVDIQALNNAYFPAIKDQTLADMCSTIAYGGVATEGPAGGMIANTLSFSVQL